MFQMYSLFGLIIIDSVTIVAWSAVHHTSNIIGCCIFPPLCRENVDTDLNFWKFPVTIGIKFPVIYGKGTPWVIFWDHNGALWKEFTRACGHVFINLSGFHKVTLEAERRHPGPLSVTQCRQRECQNCTKFEIAWFNCSIFAIFA